MSPSYPTFSSLPPLPSSPPPLNPPPTTGTHSQPTSRSSSRPPTPLHARSATGSTSNNGTNGERYSPTLPNHYNANPNYPLQPSASAQTIVPSPPRSEPHSVEEGSAFGGGGTDDHSDGEADAESAGGLDLVPNLGDSGKFLDGSGPYRFPRHRLKGAWEGESNCPEVSYDEKEKLTEGCLFFTDTTKTPLVIGTSSLLELTHSFSLSSTDLIFSWSLLQSPVDRSLLQPTSICSSFRAHSLPSSARRRADHLVLFLPFSPAVECSRWPRIRSSRKERTRSSEDTTRLCEFDLASSLPLDELG